jgi:predicted transcriptional regulator
VKELLIEGFIEAASSQTFVVSKSGYQFYERQMKPHSA